MHPNAAHALTLARSENARGNRREVQLTDPPLKLIISSHGMKTGHPPSAHFYLDCRGLIDHAPVEKVEQWVQAQWGCLEESPFYAMVKIAIAALPSRRAGRAAYGEPFHICCLCAWGRSRSVAMRELLFAHFVKEGKL